MLVRSVKGKACRGGEEKKFLHLSVIELRKYSLRLVTVPTELAELLGLTEQILVKMRKNTKRRGRGLF